MKKILTTTAFAATALIALACGAGGTEKKANEPDAIVTSAPNENAADTSPTTSAPKPASPVLRPADIKLGVKVLDKSCFGSAGCNVTFRITSVTIPESKLDKDAEYEISYTYKGLSDPQQGTFTLQGDGSYEVEAEEFGQTSNSKKVVTAVVTAVEKM